MVPDDEAIVSQHVAVGASYDDMLPSTGAVLADQGAVVAERLAMVADDDPVLPSTRSSSLTTGPSFRPTNGREPIANRFYLTAAPLTPISMSA